MLATGAGKQTEAYHIYDLAGNVWEWTEETSFYGGNTQTQYRMIRGGNCLSSYSAYPVCYRFGSSQDSITSIDIGFRIILYMK